MAPHGITALSAWLSFATEATGFDHIFPGIVIITLLCVLVIELVRRAGTLPEIPLWASVARIIIQLMLFRFRLDAFSMLHQEYGCAA